MAIMGFKRLLLDPEGFGWGIMCACGECEFAPGMMGHAEQLTNYHHNDDSTYTVHKMHGVAVWRADGVLDRQR